MLMSKFQKAQFEYHGGYLHYNTEAGERKFVARFKYSGPVTKTKFQNMLVKYYSVEEYFHKLENFKEAPLQILKNDGILEYDANARRLILDGRPL